MGKLHLYIGGVVLWKGNKLRYVGGFVDNKDVDPDTMTFLKLLGWCASMGFRNVNCLYFARPNSFSIYEISDDASIMPLVSHLFTGGEATIYVEHGDKMHPLLSTDNPKLMGIRLGLVNEEEKYMESNDLESDSCGGNEQVNANEGNNSSCGVNEVGGFRIDESCSSGNLMGQKVRVAAGVIKRNDYGNASVSDGYEQNKGDDCVWNDDDSIEEATIEGRFVEDLMEDLGLDDLHVEQFDGDEQHVEEVDGDEQHEEESNDDEQHEEEGNGDEQHEAEVDGDEQLEEEVDEQEGNDWGDEYEGTNDVEVAIRGNTGNGFQLPEEYLVDVGDLTDNEDEELRHGRSVLKGLLVKRGRNNMCEMDQVAAVMEAEEVERSNAEGSQNDEHSEPNFSENEGSFTSEHGTRRISKSHYYNPETKVPVLYVGLRFLCKSQFKQAVDKLALYQRRDLKYVKDEGLRCRTHCKDKDCNWRVLCSKDSRTGDWVVKTCQSNHSELCEEVLRNSRLTYKVMADYFIKRRGLSALSITQQEILDGVSAKWNIEASMSQCRMAKQKIVSLLQGDVDLKFDRLEDYAAELRRSNKGSTIALDTEEVDGKMVFRGMYVCLAAMKRGFKQGCRPILGVDGAFLKGPFKGELLAAIGRDANNQMYPLAWAVVEKEDMKTWKWFFLLLMRDMKIAGGTGGGWTFCSDQQKGVVRAIHDLMPHAEHRRCARHIFAKWRKKVVLNCKDSFGQPVKLAPGKTMSSS